MNYSDMQHLITLNTSAPLHNYIVFTNSFNFIRFFKIYDIYINIDDNDTFTLLNTLLTVNGHFYGYINENGLPEKYCFINYGINHPSIVSYSGYLLNGLKHGSGEEIYKDNKYIGQFENNNKHGLGHIYSLDSQLLYSGNWSFNKKHGLFVLLSNNIISSIINYDNDIVISKLLISYSTTNICNIKYIKYTSELTLTIYNNLINIITYYNTHYNDDIFEKLKSYQQYLVSDGQQEICIYSNIQLLYRGIAKIQLDDIVLQNDIEHIFHTSSYDVSISGIFVNQYLTHGKISLKNNNTMQLICNGDFENANVFSIDVENEVIIADELIAMFIRHMTEGRIYHTLQKPFNVNFSYKLNERPQLIYDGILYNNGILNTGKIFYKTANSSEILIYNGTFTSTIYNIALNSIYHYFKKGICYYINGNIQYDGNWFNSKYHGSGILYYENGNVKYVGNWNDGLYQNYGKLYSSNNNIYYDGNWDNGKYHGNGKLYYNNGNIEYNGNWNNDKHHGYGNLYFSNGNIHYDGSWTNGKYDGEGILYYINKNDNSLMTLYIGTFKNGLYDGEGILYIENNETTEAIIQFAGQFINGIPICE